MHTILLAHTLPLASRTPRLPVLLFSCVRTRFKRTVLSVHASVGWVAGRPREERTVRNTPAMESIRDTLFCVYWLGHPKFSLFLKKIHRFLRLSLSLPLFLFMRNSFFVWGKKRGEKYGRNPQAGQKGLREKGVEWCRSTIDVFRLNWSCVF